MGTGWVAFRVPATRAVVGGADPLTTAESTVRDRLLAMSQVVGIDFVVQDAPVTDPKYNLVVTTEDSSGNTMDTIDLSGSYGLVTMEYGNLIELGLTTSEGANRGATKMTSRVSHPITNNVVGQDVSLYGGGSRSTRTIPTSGVKAGGIQLYEAEVAGQWIMLAWNSGFASPTAGRRVWLGVLGASITGSGNLSNETWDVWDRAILWAGDFGSVNPPVIEEGTGTISSVSSVTGSGQKIAIGNGYIDFHNEITGYGAVEIEAAIRRLKRFDGSSWVSKPIKRYIGFGDPSDPLNWEEFYLKFYDGETWK